MEGPQMFSIHAYLEMDEMLQNFKTWTACCRLSRMVKSQDCRLQLVFMRIWRWRDLKARPGQLAVQKALH